MRISRIHTDQVLEPDSVATLDERAAHYLSRVLKLRVGDSLVLFNGDGSDYASELVFIDRNQARLDINTRLPAVAESDLHITLVQAISRGERMDYSLQKATELGVSAIQPLMTERVEVRLDEKRLAKRMVHWRGVVISACEQSGRATVPDIAHPCSLDEWLQRPGEAIRLALDPVSDRALSGQTIVKKPVELLIGPEGGLSESESRRLRCAGVVTVTLGPRILRTETAGPAAIAVLQSLSGDF